MSAAIEISGVSKWFGRVHALDGISLTVRNGEFVSIVGPSGCGKTTLLRIVAGLEESTTGYVRVSGDSPQEACRRHQIGVAFQRPALEPSRNAVDNVELTLEVTKVRNGLVTRNVLRDFGLDEESLTKYPHQLSGGMQQRVDLACALVHNPAVLLLDEPFGPLDEITREAMGEWLGGILTQSHQAVLFVTHSVDEAVLLSDRVTVLSKGPGKIVGDLAINLPRPRNRALRTKEAFLRNVIAVREVLYSTMNREGEND